MLRDNWRHNALENPDTGRGDLEVIAKAGIPVLFVYGAEDCLVPSTVIEKATSVFKEEQCRIVAVPGYHSFPISAPETLIQVVDDNSGFLGLSKAEVTESVEPG